jgi:hypothetical protein
MTQTTHGHHGVRGAGRRLALALGAASLLAGSLAAPTAHAALVRCSSDPIITLSNGHTVQISDQIYDSPTNVSKVDYQLHVPAGVTATQVTYPADNTAGIPETFEFYSDAPSGTYKSFNTVYDKNSSVTINSTATVTNTVTGASMTQTSPGHPGQAIQMLIIMKN